jgi:hypothetical protein
LWDWELLALVIRVMSQLSHGVRILVGRARLTVGEAVEVSPWVAAEVGEEIVLEEVEAVARNSWL